MRKVTKVEIASLPAVVVSLQDFNKSSSTWFDGTPESLKDRQQQVYALTNSCNSLLATSKLDDDDAALVDSWRMDLEKEAATLAESEFELAESRLQNAYDAMPNFNVMAHTDLGTSSSSDQDWDKYIELEPTKFVEANTDSVEDTEEIRYRAIREVLDKTANVEEPDRSYVVDTFVNRVEVARKISSNEHPAHTFKSRTGPDRMGLYQAECNDCDYVAGPTNAPQMMGREQRAHTKAMAKQYEREDAKANRKKSASVETTPDEWLLI